MNFPKRAWLVALCVTVLATLLACSLGNVNLVANVQPSATARPTRTPRATFTPRPAEADQTESVTEVSAEATATDTVAATATTAPTEVPQVIELPSDTPVPATKAATKPPTRRPTTPPPTRTRPPATSRPQPSETPLPAATAQPTQPQSAFQYSFIPATSCGPGACNIQNGVVCEHSGNHRIKARVYANYRDPGSALAGIRVRFSFSPGGAPIPPDEVTGGDGAAEKTLSGVTDPPSKNTGTYYVWLVDKSGAPISPYSPAININDKKPEDPSVCWAASVAFAGGK